MAVCSWMRTLIDLAIHHGIHLVNKEELTLSVLPSSKLSVSLTHSLFNYERGDQLSTQLSCSLTEGSIKCQLTTTTKDGNFHFYIAKLEGNSYTRSTWATWESLRHFKIKRCKLHLEGTFNIYATLAIQLWAKVIACSPSVTISGCKSIKKLFQALPNTLR